eukprot:gene6889-12497_t
MSGVAAADNQGEISHDQGSIEAHQAEGINDHQQDSTIAISAFHDQQSPSINTDSDSHQNTVQDQLNNLSSPGEHEVEIYDVGDNSNADESTHVWVKEEVELMFKYYKERQKDFSDPHKKKREIFVDICVQLRRHGYSPTPKQCDRKLRNMKATYIRTLERIKRGDTMATCQYYDDLYDIYGLNPPLQTPSRLLGQSRSRPVPLLKNEFMNGQSNSDMASSRESFEPAVKKFAYEGHDQRDSPMQKPDQQGDAPTVALVGSFQRDAGNPLQIFDSRLQADRKTIAELTEELKAVKNSLVEECKAREEERKAFAEERREFHKERMSMLNSINKLIGNIDQK